MAYPQQYIAAAGSGVSEAAERVTSTLRTHINVIIWQHLLNNLVVKRRPIRSLPNYRIVRRPICARFTPGT